MGSAIVRQWHLLTLLPRGPRRIDTASLENQLRARGLDAHRRTIQRDLIELGRTFPIVSDERRKPYGWCWADDAELPCAIAARPGGTEPLRQAVHCGVADGCALRRWLFGLAATLEVLAPADLRDEVAEMANRMAATSDRER